MLKKIIIGFLAIILLTGCSETTHDNYKFTGESDHWEAQYAYDRTEKWGEKKAEKEEEKEAIKTFSSEDSYEFNLKYKGSLEELSSLQTLEYSYETISSSGKTTEEFTDPPTTIIFKSQGSSKGAAKVSKDEVIKVTVKWDDLEESILLENKSN